MLEEENAFLRARIRRLESGTTGPEVRCWYPRCRAVLGWRRGGSYRLALPVGQVLLHPGLVCFNAAR